MNIVLFGPFCAGKTATATILSERLNISHYQVDRIKWYYHFKNDFRWNKANKIYNETGFLSVIEYMQSTFRIQDLINLITEFDKGILDFGAYEAYQELPNLHLLKAALSNHVKILVIPSINVNTNIDILNARLISRVQAGHCIYPQALDDYLYLNEKFINHESNVLLPDHVIYTKNLSETEVCDEIFRRIK